MPTSGVDLAGIKLVAAGALTVLFPLILAIAGAVFAGSGKTRQVVGAVIGLIIGIVIAAVTVRLFMKANRSPKTDIEDKEHR